MKRRKGMAAVHQWKILDDGLVEKEKTNTVDEEGEKWGI